MTYNPLVILILQHMGLHDYIIPSPLALRLLKLPIQCQSLGSMAFLMVCPDKGRLHLANLDPKCLHRVSPDQKCLQLVELDQRALHLVSPDQRGLHLASPDPRCLHLAGLDLRSLHLAGLDLRCLHLGLMNCNMFPQTIFHL